MANESTAIATRSSGFVETAFGLGEISVSATIARKKKIIEVMDAVMRPDVHYGKIPGCGDKPSLFKPGAEVLATTFGLAPKFAIAKTEFPRGHREYEITCTIWHIGSHTELGDGVGSCTTMESKYRWRGGGKQCPTCEEGAIRISKYGGWWCDPKKGGCGAEFKPGTDGAKLIESSPVRAENPDIADTYNTVLKMAKKRALIDATLTATGASDAFGQDLEDLAEAARYYADVEDAEFTELPNDRQGQRGEQGQSRNAGGYSRGPEQPSDRPPPAPTSSTAPSQSRDERPRGQQQQDIPTCEATAAELAELRADIAATKNSKSLKKDINARIRGFGQQTRDALRPVYDERLSAIEDDERYEREHFAPGGAS